MNPAVAAAWIAAEPFAFLGLAYLVLCALVCIMVMEGTR